MTEIPKNSKELNEFAERVMLELEKDVSSLIKDSDVLYFVTKDAFQKDKEGNDIYSPKIISKKYTITKELKEKIFTKIQYAKIEGIQVPIVLVPQSLVKCRNLYKEHPYPLRMFGCKVYFTKVPEVLCIDEKV